jgi:predicted DsbA family dithiol-disulfide isomerase
MAAATPRLKIDFVSDVACPWCAIGLNALERALERLADEVQVDLQFQPFELNPAMPPEGEDAVEHLARKYGASAQQLAATRERLRERGAEVGFQFGQRERIWNTFDAHRLLHWAGPQGKQRELKHALLRAYHTRGENPGAHDVLQRAAAEVGLDVDAARRVLESGEFADAVREREQHFQQLGVHAVPAVIIDDEYLISGGQPVEVFEQALREVAEKRR